jgi:hypothetical protein
MQIRIHSLLAAALVGGLVVPAGAWAQTTGACGQTAVLTETLQAPLSPGFAPIRQFVQIRRNEPRYVEFSLDTPQDLTLRTEAPTIDPTIALYDRGGQVVAWDDDGGGGTDALVAQSLSAGDYCVQVRPIGAEPVDFAELVLILEEGFTVLPGQEAPCTAATTQDLAMGVSSPFESIALDGVTDPASGRSDYRLSLAGPLGMRIDLASGEFDTLLEVYDAAGNQVATNDDFSGTDSRVEQAFAPGDYCVVARGFDDGGGAYTMAMSESDVEPPPLPCSDPALTTVLATGFGPEGEAARAQGSIDPDLLRSWFALNVAAPVDVQIDARSAALDTILEIHDSTGSLVAENDDGPDGTNSRVETALAAGDYCVTVRDYNDATGAFDLSLVPVGMAPPPTPNGGPDPAQATEVEDMGVLGDIVRSYTIGGGETLWASFTLESPAPVTVSGMSVSSEFSVALFAQDGTPLGEAGPVAAMNPAEVTADLPAGAFMVALTNHGATGTILRQITVSRN